MRSKAKRNVIALFPHRAVTLVVVRTQGCGTRGVASRLCHGLGGITHLQSEQWPDVWLLLLRNNVISPLALRPQKERRHLPVIPGLILHTLGRRPISKIVVTREPRRSRQVRLARPQPIISAGIT